MMKLPLVGLGTWELRGDECERVVREALELGYRHIDTAHLYSNHEAIGKAIAPFDRAQLFITSKLALSQIDWHKIEVSVEKACDEALKELQTDYIDLYLLHWPRVEGSHAEIFDAMEKLIEKGKIRQMGASNFTIDELKEERRISANQVEFHPYLFQKELWEFCKSDKIQLISYRSFGKGALLEEPLFHEVGKKHNKLAAQVVLRWIVQRGIAVIPKASSRKHLAENLSILDYSLSSEEMERIDALNRGQSFTKRPAKESN
ncbi:MAG: aldo/keto reductase [Verrucomicrobia bacterium]|nr:aldo/keto reductase [Verrucomicrobiota bacterium]